MTQLEAEQLIDDYEALVDRAIQICGAGCGYYASVDYDDWPRLRIEPKPSGDEGVLIWREYESDYYGGGHCEDETARFPAELLFLSDEDFEKWKTTTAKEIIERDERVRAAQEAVARDRQIAQERAMLAMLKRKYEGTP